MSTLLKKKYCQERWSSESIGVGLSTSGQDSDLVLTMTMIPISTSPVSVTVSNDDDSAQTSIAQMAITENIECLDTTNGSCGIKRKSVRFSDNNMASIDNDFSELVHKYRTDIWYTVRCVCFFRFYWVKFEICAFYHLVVQWHICSRITTNFAHLQTFLFAN